MAESFWSTEDIETQITNEKADGTFDVVCKVPHLTSFAVLLDVNNALSVKITI